MYSTWAHIVVFPCALTCYLTIVIQLCTCFFSLDMLLYSNKTSWCIAPRILLLSLVKHGLGIVSCLNLLIWRPNLTNTNNLITPLRCSVPHVVVERILSILVVGVDEMIGCILSRDMHFMGCSSQSLRWKANDIIIYTLLSTLFCICLVEIDLCCTISRSKLW